MPVRRTTAALAAGAIATTMLTVGGLSGSSATAQVDPTPGYTLRHITVDVLVGPDNDAPCTISADIYKPDSASKTHKAPAILTTHGFGGSKNDERQTGYAKGFVREGYVVLSYSGLGFGGSGCKIHLDDPDWDGKAGKQLVSVLAGSKAFTAERNGEPGRIRYVAKEGPGDPRVGMIGVSYGGHIQYSVAMQDKRIDALIPLITWNDLTYSLAPNNTGFDHGVTYKTPGVHKRQWSGLFFGLGILDGLDDPQVDPARNVGCPNFVNEACVAMAQMLSMGYPDENTLRLARHASVSTYISRIKAPTLVVQGQRDTLFNLQEGAATFRSLRANGTEARMIWQQSGHSGEGAPGEFGSTPGSLRGTYLGRRFLNWMDRYVRGDKDVSPGPRFEYFRDWVDYDTSKAHAGSAVANAYAQRSSFSEKPTASLFFTGTDALTRNADAVVAGSASYTNALVTPTSYSETSGLEGGDVNNPVSDGPGTFVDYTSPALSEAVAMVGSPSLTLHLDAPLAEGTQSGGPGGHLMLFAKVYDVAPDGTETLKNRLISPVRVTDVTKSVRVQLPGVVHQFKKGHKIRIVIAASDFAYANNLTEQPVTVQTSKAAPSVLRLPLTGAMRF